MPMTTHVWSREISCWYQQPFFRLGVGSLLFAVALVWVSLPCTQAQTATGSVAGSVKDPSGAAVSNAAVTLTNVATNEARVTKSNDLGYYSFP